MIVPLTGVMIDFGFNKLVEVPLIVVIVAVSHATDARAGIIIDVLAETMIVVDVDVLADVDGIMWAVTLTDLEFMPIPASVVLHFNWEACSC